MVMNNAAAQLQSTRFVDARGVPPSMRATVSSADSGATEALVPRLYRALSRATLKDSKRLGCVDSEPVRHVSLRVLL
jgi:hypothetical protein